MKVTRNLLVILLSLILSAPVLAKGSHGGRSSTPHSHSSHASKKSHAAGSNDGHYEDGQALQEQENRESLSRPETRNSELTSFLKQ
jgi:hypothetical protein